MFIVRCRGPAQPVKLWGVECSGDDLGCRGKMCVSLTPCRDSRACTFLECMEDYSTSGDLSSSHPRKRVAVRIRGVAYSFWNRRPNWRNGMEHPTISLSHARAGPLHRTMNRRSRSHVLGSLRPNYKYSVRECATERKNVLRILLLLFC